MPKLAVNTGGKNKNDFREPYLVKLLLVVKNLGAERVCFYTLGEPFHSLLELCQNLPDLEIIFHRVTNTTVQYNTHGVALPVLNTNKGGLKWVFSPLRHSQDDKLRISTFFYVILKRGACRFKEYSSE
jgi:hypothetical protein